jgi:predicted DsbA family dithiol-disulfide isomerase
MNRLLLYHDFASPYSRLAEQVAGRAARRTGMTLRAVPFELRPAPAPLPGPEEVDRTELDAAERFAAEWELELGRLVRVPRTRKAHEAVAHARHHGAEAPVLRSIYDALWRDGLDISRLDVLADLGEAAGLDREAMHVALGVDDYEDEVVREQDAAAAAGLTGVPAVQVRDVVAVGVFPLDELVEWIESNR